MGPGEAMVNREREGGRQHSREGPEEGLSGAEGIEQGDA